MDLNILVAALSLLVAGLAELRATRRDLQKDQIRPFGISLLQLMLALDNIIETGEQLILLFADISASKDEEKTEWAVLRDKRRLLLPLIESQKENLETFSKIYETPLGFTGTKTPLSLGDTIKLMVPDQVKKEIGMVRDRKKPGLVLAEKVTVLSWVVEPASAFNQLIKPVNQALRMLASSLHLSQGVGQLYLKLPTKVKFQHGHAEVEENVEYDLTKLSDLRRLLEKSKSQLDDIKKLRDELSQIIRATFSIEELLKAQ